jgi:nitrate/nitrite transporter NarK
MVERAAAAIALLSAASIAIGLFRSNVWATTQTLAGPQAAGKWTGIQNAVGNLGGVVSPIVTGLVVARMHSYLPAFLAASAVALAGAACYVVSIRELAPIPWPAADHSKRSISAR